MLVEHGERLVRRLGKPPLDSDRQRLVVRIETLSHPFPVDELPVVLRGLLATWNVVVRVGDDGVDSLAILAVEHVATLRL